MENDRVNSCQPRAEFLLRVDSWKPHVEYLLRVDTRKPHREHHLRVDSRKPHGEYLIRVDSRKPHGESPTWADSREPRKEHALSTYEKPVGNTFAVSALQQYRGAHDTIGRQQPGRANFVMGDSLVILTVKSQLTVRTSYRMALGYGRIYYRNSHSRKRLSTTAYVHLLWKVSRIHTFSREDYTDLGTRISSCLPVFTRRSFVPGFGCRCCGDVGH